MRELTEDLRRFAAERDWEQFHSPKNLAMALSVEVAEIVELFQWMTERESRELSQDKKDRAREEIGDVLIYVARLADQLGIDPLEAARQKLEVNRRKYPTHRVKGSARKYTDYPSEGEDSST